MIRRSRRRRRWWLLAIATVGLLGAAIAIGVRPRPVPDLDFGFLGGGESVVVDLPDDEFATEVDRALAEGVTHLGHLFSLSESDLTRGRLVLDALAWSRPWRLAAWHDNATGDWVVIFSFSGPGPAGDDSVRSRSVRGRTLFVGYESRCWIVGSRREVVARIRDRLREASRTLVRALSIRRSGRLGSSEYLARVFGFSSDGWVSTSLELTDPEVAGAGPHDRWLLRVDTEPPQRAEPMASGWSEWLQREGVTVEAVGPERGGPERGGSPMAARGVREAFDEVIDSLRHWNEW